MSKPSGHTRERDELQATGAGGPRAGDETEAAYRASGTVALSAVKPRSGAALEDPPRRTVPLPGGRDPDGERPGKRRRRRRIPSGLIVIVVVLAMLGGGFWLATRAVYFVGVDAERGNTVTIYRGLPIELPLGIELYSRYAGSGVSLQTVIPSRRATFTDHKLRSKDDAENLLIQLERGQLDS